MPRGRTGVGKLACMLTVLAIALSGPARAAESLHPTKLLALVNGRPVTVGKVAGALRRRRIKPANAPRRVWLAELDTAINRELLLAAAKADRGNTKDAPRSPPTAKADANNKTEQALIRAYIARKFHAKLFVPASEVRQWYERHKQTLRTGEVRIARVITISARKRKRDFVTDERAVARIKIDAIRKQALAGKDFAALARKHSMDPYAARGGLLPPVRKTGASNFAAEVFKIKNKGGVSEVFETPFGLHIVKLETIRPPTVPPFDKVEAQIRQKLRQRKWAKHVVPHLAQLRGQADIRIMKKALPGADAPSSPK